jgi:hypothetical protein
LSKIDLLFYGSAALCILSFLLFCYEVIVHMRRTAPPPALRGTGDETRPEAIDAREAMQEMRSLVQSFAKAGPIPTTAGLCVLFLLIAVISSGLVKIAASTL